MPLTPPFVDTEFKKEKSLYLREPLFQFFGLCTIVEKEKKNEKKVISIQNKAIVLHQKSEIICVPEIYF